MFRPIRGQYPGHMIFLDQSEASIRVTTFIDQSEPSLVLHVPLALSMADHNNLVSGHPDQSGNGESENSDI